MEPRPELPRNEPARIPLDLRRRRTQTNAPTDVEVHLVLIPIGAGDGEPIVRHHQRRPDNTGSVPVRLAAARPAVAGASART